MKNLFGLQKCKENAIFTIITVDNTRIKPFSTYVCTEQVFGSQPFMRNKIIKKKIVIEVCTSHLYTSFSTIYIQSGQLFEAQPDFKLLEEF